jgi:hypothetical protein
MKLQMAGRRRCFKTRRTVSVTVNEYRMMREVILKIEFVALMIFFWGMIIVWPLYNWLTS